jgi:hypothetical protein
MDLSKHDLKVELSPSQLSKVDSWLEIFYSKCKSRMSAPIVEDGSLKISSADIYNFLHVIKDENENRFDWYRLRAVSRKGLTELGQRKKDQALCIHYKSFERLLGDLSW